MTEQRAQYPGPKRILMPQARFDELLIGGWIDGIGNRTEKFKVWLLNAKPGDTDGPPEWAAPYWGAE